MAVTVSLTINVTDKGQISITGPLHDRVLCYGLLEAARDIIHAHKPQDSIIVPGVVLPMGKGGGN